MLGNVRSGPLPRGPRDDARALISGQTVPQPPDSPSVIMSSYIIVGAGVFGVSTALHLKQNSPSATVSLIDRTDPPCPLAASNDINKIVRADYEDLFYCKLGLKTLHKWRTDPFFKKWYHECGLLTVTDKNSSVIDKILENFKTLNVDRMPERFGPGELSSKFGGIFDMRMNAEDKLLFNPVAGIAEAEKALRATIQACIDLGVQYIASPVSRLIISSGVCRGVQTQDGVYYADHTVLCTGAGTAKLIADSAPKEQDLQVGRRITARAVCCSTVELDGSRKTFNNVPAVAYHASPIYGEAMPPTDGLLKFVSEVSFINTVHHDQSGQDISLPMLDPASSQWTLPEKMPRALREDLDDVMNGIYGQQAAGLKPSSYRICWDGATPDNNWFICPHPRCSKLYIATAGSFHGWKFLPIVGEYVVQMLQDTLSEEMKRRWSWDRPLGNPKPDPCRPKKEFREIKGVGSARL
ncbi:MAG: hypothetical protein Q9220_003289 [cf. Caloplaca sp. 1 TL-2023]